MGFNFGKTLKGAVPGALVGGAVGGPFGALLGGGLGAVGGGFGLLDPEEIKQNQVPLETEEQRQARKKLLDFANTGVFGKFKAGEDLGLGFGDYGITPTEQVGLTGLQDLLTSGIPAQYSLGDEALRSMLTVDPNQISATFDPYRAQVERAIRDSIKSSKRDLAYTGNLYSTKAIQDLGDVRARGNETMAGQLAELTNQALNRRLQAIPLAYQSAQAQDAQKLSRVAASQQYGALTRQLNDAAIKSRDAEILRRRQELGMPIQAAQSVIGAPVQFGVPEITTYQQSPLMDILNLVVQGGTRLATAGRAG